MSASAEIIPVSAQNTCIFSIIPQIKAAQIISLPAQKVPVSSQKIPAQIKAAQILHVSAQKYLYLINNTCSNKSSSKNTCICSKIPVSSQ